MEVVRWLCLEPHPHLQRTQFLIHSHNSMAAGMMALQIRVAGFQVEHRPFGMTTALPAPDDPFWNQRPGWQEWLSRTVNAWPPACSGENLTAIGFGTSAVTRRKVKTRDRIGPA